MLGAYIRNAPPRVYNTTVSVLVFQTGYVGSIPTRRSKRFLSKLYFLCSHSMHCSSVGRAPDPSGGRWFESSYKRNLDFWPRRITGLVRRPLKAEIRVRVPTELLLKLLKIRTERTNIVGSNPTSESCNMSHLARDIVS